MDNYAVQVANKLIQAADQEIGRGNSAKVYVDSKFPSLCYKVIHNGRNVHTPEGEAKFLDEVNKLTNESVGTPNTEATFFFEYPESKDGERCSTLVMQRIYGMSLQEIINKQQFPEGAEPTSREDFSKLRKTFRNVREFIQAMNKQLGIYHNDLYLRNVMLDENWRWWVIDFGEATKEHFQQQVSNIDIETIKNTWNSFAEFTISYVDD
jgi:serine/threonine protein kinase